MTSKPTARERFLKLKDNLLGWTYIDDQFLLDLVEAAATSSKAWNRVFHGNKENDYDEEFWQEIDQRLSANDLSQVRVDTAEGKK